MTFTVQIGVRAQTFVPKGGVVADTVGMGKTAELIALLLARPPERDDGNTLGALVLTPEHLCHQWREELNRFAGDALDVLIATNEAEVLALSPSAWRGRGGTARVRRASPGAADERMLHYSILTALYMIPPHHSIAPPIDAPPCAATPPQPHHVAVQPTAAPPTRSTTMLQYSHTATPPRSTALPQYSHTVAPS